MAKKDRTFPYALLFSLTNDHLPRQTGAKQPKRSMHMNQKGVSVFSCRTFETQDLWDGRGTVENQEIRTLEALRHPSNPGTYAEARAELWSEKRLRSQLLSAFPIFVPSLSWQNDRF
jgi:hypothetical protein